MLVRSMAHGRSWVPHACRVRQATWTCSRERQISGRWESSCISIEGRAGRIGMAGLLDEMDRNGARLVWGLNSG